eukprot:294973_1
MQSMFGWFKWRRGEKEENASFLRAIVRGDHNVVVRILGDEEDKRSKRKVDFNFRDEQGNTPLILAALHKRDRILRTILQYDGVLSRRNNSGKTALHVAVENNVPDSVQRLLNARADVEDRMNGLTPLMVAAREGYKEMVKLLIDYGADPTAKQMVQIPSSSKYKTVDVTAAALTSSRKIRKYLLRRIRHKKHQIRAEMGVETMSADEGHNSDYSDPSPTLESWELYSLKHKIRGGAFGEAFVAENRVTRAECVVKVVSANNFEEVNDALLEGLWLSLFRNCPRIVHFQDFYIHFGDSCDKEKFSNVAWKLSSYKSIDHRQSNVAKGHCSVHIAMEYARGGDLFTHVANRVAAAQEELKRKRFSAIVNRRNSAEAEIRVEPERFTEVEVAHFVGQICEGLEEIHRCKLIHRDIKPANIFLDRKLNVILGDFGIAKLVEDAEFLSTNGLIAAETVIGTGNYMAPEITLGRGYSQDVDIFAVGCVVYFMVCMRHPNFMMRHPLTDVFPDLRRHSHNPEFLERLVERCWQPPGQRPTAGDLRRWCVDMKVPDLKASPNASYDPVRKTSISPTTGVSGSSRLKYPARRRYRIGKRISEDLYRCTNKESSVEMMMKRVRCHTLGDVNSSLREAATYSYLGRCTCPHVLSIHEVFLDQMLSCEADPSGVNIKDKTKIDETISVCIVTQYCAGGSLYRFLKRLRSVPHPTDPDMTTGSGNGGPTPEYKYLPESFVLSWFYQIACGLKEIHESNTIHRDIQSKNLFIDHDRNILIGDFATAKDVSFESAHTIVSAALCYMAPELLELNTSDSRSKTYTSAVDIYSLGIVIVEILTLQQPRLGDRLPVHPTYGDYLQQAVRRMTDSDPARRPTAAQLVCELRERVFGYTSRAWEESDESGNMSGEGVEKSTKDLTNRTNVWQDSTMSSQKDPSSRVSRNGKYRDSGEETPRVKYKSSEESERSLKMPRETPKTPKSTIKNRAIHPKKIKTDEIVKRVLKNEKSSNNIDQSGSRRTSDGDSAMKNAEISEVLNKHKFRSRAHSSSDSSRGAASDSVKTDSNISIECGRMSSRSVSSDSASSHRSRRSSASSPRDGDHLNPLKVYHNRSSSGEPGSLSGTRRRRRSSGDTARPAEEAGRATSLSSSGVRDTARHHSSQTTKDGGKLMLFCPPTDSQSTVSSSYGNSEMSSMSEVRTTPTIQLCLSMSSPSIPQTHSNPVATIAHLSIHSAPSCIQTGSRTSIQSRCQSRSQSSSQSRSRSRSQIRKLSLPVAPTLLLSPPSPAPSHSPPPPPFEIKGPPIASSRSKHSRVTSVFNFQSINEKRPPPPPRRTSAPARSQAATRQLAACHEATGHLSTCQQLSSQLATTPSHHSNVSRSRSASRSQTALLRIFPNLNQSDDSPTHSAEKYSHSTSMVNCDQEMSNCVSSSNSNSQGNSSISDSNNTTASLESSKRSKRGSLSKESSKSQSKQLLTASQSEQLPKSLVTFVSKSKHFTLPTSSRPKDPSPTASRTRVSKLRLAIAALDTAKTPKVESQTESDVSEADKQWAMLCSMDCFLNRTNFLRGDELDLNLVNAKLQKEADHYWSILSMLDSGFPKDCFRSIEWKNEWNLEKLKRALHGTDPLSWCSNLRCFTQRKTIGGIPAAICTSCNTPFCSSALSARY